MVPDDGLYVQEDLGRVLDDRYPKSEGLSVISLCIQ